MKVFCPIDFSEASVNACKWLVPFLSKFKDSSVHLAHFIYVKRRASMFLAIDDLFREKAEQDMNRLIEELEKMSGDISFSYSIYLAHPKDGIIYVSDKDNYDLVVTGSTGLTALKNMTIGSVTEHVVTHSKLPVLTIPDTRVFKGGKKILLAVDDEPIDKLSSLNILKDICIGLDASLNIIHVTEKNESPFEYDPSIDVYFSDLDFEYTRLEKDGSIAHTINEYGDHENIDIMCMLHHKRNWFGRLFSKSITKSELFSLEFPLLILNEG